MLTSRRTFLTGALILVGIAASLPAAAQDAAKRGQEVYTAQKCSVCHSGAGKGGKNRPRGVFYPKQEDANAAAPKPGKSR